MSAFPRPNLVVSKCLGFAACRWNGQTIPDHFVESLKPFVTFHPLCPEAEIGLGIPRDPIRVVEQDGSQRLMQPATGRDVTQLMEQYAKEQLSGLDAIDGFVLKSRSPSCGIKDVRVYPALEKKPATTAKGQGFFGREVLDRFSHLAVEDEGRLSDFRIREHFLTKLFALARLREIEGAQRMRDLIDFHSRAKYLLMASSQRMLSQLGKIVANHERHDFPAVMRLYRGVFSEALARPARYTSNINAMMHAVGYFKKQLGQAEKNYFFEQLEQYRQSKVPLSVPLAILRSLAIRFEDAYLQEQFFFQPFPDELVTVTDSGKGRERRG